MSGQGYAERNLPSLFPNSFSPLDLSKADCEAEELVHGLYLISLVKDTGLEQDSPASSVPRLCYEPLTLSTSEALGLLDLRYLTDRKSMTTEISYLDMEGEIVSDLNQKVENLNDYFVSAGSALNSRFPANTQHIQTTLEEANSVFKFKEINIKAVENAILQLKSKRSFEVDGVLSYFLKITAPLISKSLAKIFNTSVKIFNTPLMGDFPEGWKISRIAPIY